MSLYYLPGNLQATCPHAPAHLCRIKGTKTKQKRLSLRKEPSLDTQLDHNEIN